MPRHPTLSDEFLMRDTNSHPPAYAPTAFVPLDSRAYRFDIVLRGRRATLFENRTQVEAQ